MAKIFILRSSVAKTLLNTFFSTHFLLLVKNLSVRGSHILFDRIHMNFNQLQKKCIKNNILESVLLKFFFYICFVSE